MIITRNVNILPDEGSIDVSTDSNPQWLSVDSNVDIEIVRSLRGRKELELVADQLDKIESLRESTKSKLKILSEEFGDAKTENDIQQKIGLKKEMNRVIADYHSAALDVLLPHQKQMISSYKKLMAVKQIGLVEALVNGVLSDKQLNEQEQARVRSNAVEMEQFVANQLKKIQKDAVDILLKDISVDQQKMVHEFLEIWSQEKFFDTGSLMGGDRVKDCKGCDSQKNVQMTDEPTSTLTPTPAAKGK